MKIDKRSNFSLSCENCGHKPKVNILKFKNNFVILCDECLNELISKSIEYLEVNYENRS